MNKIIGRKQEIEELENLYFSGKPEFVAIYGRRRVGKTFLVKELFQSRLTFYHSGLSPYDKERKVTMRDQLDSFYASLTRWGLEEQQRPKTWMEAFGMLASLLETLDNGERQFVFIDELPWMDTPRSKFLIALENFWNSWGAWHDHVMLVVCGSATSWMLDNLINSKGGLYDRLTWQIKLSPFTLSECRQFFDTRNIVMSEYDVAEAYMVVGGIPYYLNYFQRGKSLAQNIDALFFSKNAKLASEFNRLFGSLFANPDDYKKIVMVLARQHVGFTRDDIAKKLGISPGGSFSKMLEALAESDFIMPYHPFGTGKKEVRYKLTDSFCQFYLDFVEGKNVYDESYWMHHQSHPRLNAWRGIAFEQLCFKHVANIKRSLGVEGVASSESSWIVRGSDDREGAQIDMLIVRDDRVVNLCEMKFLASEYVPDFNEEIKLRKRIANLQELLSFKQTIHLTLITSLGVKPNAHSGIIQKVVTLKQLFD